MTKPNHHQIEAKASQLKWQAGIVLRLVEDIRANVPLSEAELNQLVFSAGEAFDRAADLESSLQEQGTPVKTIAKRTTPAVAFALRA